VSPPADRLDVSPTVCAGVAVGGEPERAAGVVLLVGVLEQPQRLPVGRVQHDRVGSRKAPVRIFVISLKIASGRCPRRQSLGGGEPGPVQDAAQVRGGAVAVEELVLLGELDEQHQAAVDVGLDVGTSLIISSEILAVVAILRTTSVTCAVVMSDWGLDAPSATAAAALVYAVSCT
jgi:hypothetical protein